MKLVDFFKRFTPETFTLVIRNDRLFRYDKTSDSYKNIFNVYEGFVGLTDTDVVYNFPNETCIYEHLKLARCLDIYKVNHLSCGKKDRIETIKERIKAGKLIGAHYSDGKRHVTLESDNTLTATNKTGTIINRKQTHFGYGNEIKIWEFDNQYKFFEWLHKEEKWQWEN